MTLPNQPTRRSSGPRGISRKAAEKLIRALRLVLSRAIFRTRADYVEVTTVVEDSIRAVEPGAPPEASRRKARPSAKHAA